MIQCPRLKRCFTKPSTVAYKRSKNIRDILVRAKFSLKRRPTRFSPGYRKCTRNILCVTCMHSDLGPGEKAAHHKCQKTGQEWNISGDIDCQTSNVVYKLTCKKCPEWVYIGETGKRFCERLTQHRGYITGNKDQPAGRHFNSPGHQLSDMVAIAFEKVRPSNEPMIRKQREKYWIQQYDAVCHGANTRY